MGYHSFRRGNRIMKEELDESLFNLNEGTDFIAKLDKYLKDKKIFPIDIEIKNTPEDIDNLSDITLSIEIDGDWKHEHLRTDYLIKEFCEENGFSIVDKEEEIIEDNDSDTYVSEHIYYLYSIFNDSLDEDLETDKEELKIKEEETSDETPDMKDNGVASLIIAAINDEWNTIKMYNDLIVNLEYFDHENKEDFVNVIKDITKEENIHVGQLQKLLSIISPTTDNIANGEDEAEEQLTESLEYAKEFTAGDMLSDSFGNLSDEEIDDLIRLTRRIALKLGMKKNDSDNMIVYAGVEDCDISELLDRATKIDDIQGKFTTASIYEFNDVKFAVEFINTTNFLYFKDENDANIIIGIDIE